MQTEMPHWMQWKSIKLENKQRKKGNRQTTDERIVEETENKQKCTIIMIDIIIIYSICSLLKSVIY